MRSADAIEDEVRAGRPIWIFAVLLLHLLVLPASPVAARGAVSEPEGGDGAYLAAGGAFDIARPVSPSPRDPKQSSDAMVAAAIAEGSGHCPSEGAGEIVVCGTHRKRSQRLLPDDSEDSASDRYPSGAAALAADRYHCGPTSCDPPNRQMETIHRIWQAITGDDGG